MINTDSIDVKILEVLQENARVSISDLSKRVNLSLSAVSERLKKLAASGIILQYPTLLTPEILNRQLSVIMMISLENPSQPEEFLKFVHDNPDILECDYIAGEYDYSIKVVTANTVELEHIMNKIKGVSSIKRTQTNVVLRTIKQLHSIGPAATK